MFVIQDGLRKFGQSQVQNVGKGDRIVLNQCRLRIPKTAVTIRRCDNNVISGRGGDQCYTLFLWSFLGFLTSIGLGQSCPFFLHSVAVIGQFPQTNPYN